MDKSIIIKPRGIILFTLFFCLLILFGLSIVFYTKPEVRLFILLFIFFILYGVYYTVRSFTYLKAGIDFITLGFNTKYNYREISKFELYDYKDYRFLFFPIKQECLTIIFEDGKEVKLEDNYYTNLWKLRWILENKLIRNNHSFDFDFNLDFDCQRVINKTVPISSFVKLTSYLLYFWLLLFSINIILILFDNYSYIILLLISLFVIMALVYFCRNSYYLESCDIGIYVKNLVFRNVKIKINLNQIESISIKTMGGGRSKRTFLIIHMVYHRNYKFSVDLINKGRIENIIHQVRNLNVSFYDHRY